MIKRMVAAAAPLVLFGLAACAHPQGAAAELPEDITVMSSAISQTFAADLPNVLSFSDRMGTALVATPSSALETTGTPTVTEFHAGDVAYREVDQMLVIFLSENSSAPAGEVYLLGHVTSGLEVLADCVRDCQVQITVDGGGTGNP